jgi:hypothetical protein
MRNEIGRCLTSVQLWLFDSQKCVSSCPGHAAGETANLQQKLALREASLKFIGDHKSASAPSFEAFLFGKKKLQKCKKCVDKKSRKTRINP